MPGRFPERRRNFSADADLLDPRALARIGQLELLSTRVVDGFLSGKHRSTHKGGCFEFAEHRAYAPGDEIRLIDWRVYARSDRYYVKEFEEETNLQAVMLVDTSGSMEFGLSTATKFNYARMACACLSRLVLRQRDAVGLSLFAEDRHRYVPPRARAAHLQPILTGLRRARCSGAGSLGEHLNTVASRMKRRGMVIMFSDCFGPLDPLARALHHVRSRGHEALLFHVMAPEELSFSFTKWSRFENLEQRGHWLDADPAAVRRDYLKRVQAFLDELKRCCARLGCDYMPVSTDQALGDVLAHYLGRRMASHKLSSGRGR